MQTANPFKQVEDEYFKLKGRLAAGRLTEQQFQDALQQLMLQDAQGRYWMLGKTSGKWNVYDGAQWSEADPYASGVIANVPVPTPPPTPSPSTVAPPIPPPRAEPHIVPAPPPQPAPRKGGGCFTCRNLGCGCLALIVIVVLVIGGGYLAYTNGVITQKQLLNLVGLGPASVQVDNFRDDQITVTVTQLDVAKDSTPDTRSAQPNAFDVKLFQFQTAGKYRVDFKTVNQSANIGTCTLTLRGGDQYQFVTLPERIAVNRVNNPSKVGSDFVITTSALCR